MHASFCSVPWGSVLICLVLSCTLLSTPVSLSLNHCRSPIWRSDNYWKMKMTFHYFSFHPPNFDSSITHLQCSSSDLLLDDLLKRDVKLQLTNSWMTAYRQLNSLKTRASVVKAPKSSHTTVTLHSLHWLKMTECIKYNIQWVTLSFRLNQGYVSPCSCWPKSAVVDRQRCSSYAAVMPDSPLPAAVNKRYRPIYGHNWRTQ